MGAGVVGHRDEHRGQPVHIAGGSVGFLMRGPDAVDDRRMAGIGRRLVIELAAEVDDLQWRSPLLRKAGLRLDVGPWRQCQACRLPSLRAQRSNPSFLLVAAWIASLRSQ